MLNGRLISLSQPRESMKAVPTKWNRKLKTGFLPVYGLGNVRGEERRQEMGDVWKVGKR